MANDAFPLDFAALQKGDIIPQEKIEQIYQVKWRDDPKRYAFCKMNLADEIVAHWRDLFAHVRSHGEDLEVMNDLQAEVHTKRKFEQSRRRITKATQQRETIDRSGFDAANRAAAESQDRLQYASVIGLRKIEEAARRNELLGITGSTPELEDK